MSHPAMLLGRAARSRWFSVVVSLTVAVAWSLFLYRQLPLLQSYLALIKPAFLAAALAWGILYFVGQALCWTIVLNRMAAPNRVALLSGAQIWLRSMLTRYIPGNVWHIVGRVMLAAQRNVSGTLVVASATVEQAVMLLAAVCVTAMTLPFWTSMPTAYSWLLLLVPLGLVGLHPALFNWAFAWASRLMKRPAPAYRHTYGDIFTYLLLYSTAMLCSGVALVILVSSLAPVPLAVVPFLVGAAALAWAIGFVSFVTPSGLGVREAVLVALLVQHYPLPVALAASLLFRLVLTLGEMLAVALSYGWSRFLSPRTH